MSIALATGAIERRDPGDAAVGIGTGAGLGTDKRGDLADGEPRSPVEEKGLGHAVEPWPAGGV